MTRHPLLLIAASGLAREVLPVVRESGREILGFLDDRHDELPSAIGGAHVLGGIDDVVRYPRADILVCLGSGLDRERVVARLSVLGIESERYSTVIDPSVRNPGACPVGPGSILLAGVVITTDAVIGEHVVVMPRVTITHDCVVGDFATLAAGVALGGGVRVGRGAFLGMNCSVRQGLSIGIGATIGMGAVVLNDVHSAETWAGIPARRLEVTE